MVTRRVAYRAALAAGLGLVVWAGVPRTARAHCDSVGGPVLTEAREALAEGRVERVFKWVPAEAEAEVRASFDDAVALRGAGQAARRVAETRFYETLVRLHRASEGEPYTGLRTDEHADPAAELADQAIADGDVDQLAERVAHEVEAGIKTRYAAMQRLRAHRDDSVAAGREYVASYVEFVHYVKNLHDLAAADGTAHGAHHHGE